MDRPIKSPIFLTAHEHVSDPDTFRIRLLSFLYCTRYIIFLKTRTNDTTWHVMGKNYEVLKQK
jgi:hypothetical protein